jgi:hypothetical protein
MVSLAIDYGESSTTKVLASIEDAEYTGGSWDSNDDIRYIHIDFGHSNRCQSAFGEYGRRR